MSDDYCDHCDLPLSQCIHGRPPVEPAPTLRSAPKTRSGPAIRKRPTTPKAPARPTKTVPRRFTPPDAFKPLIFAALTEAGGTLDNDAVFVDLEARAADLLLPGDHELTPEGELRWRYAARRARLALIKEGTMTKSVPGVWTLA